MAPDESGALAGVRQQSLSLIKSGVKMPAFSACARAAKGGSATTSMQVAADLRRRILRGEFEPGARLKIDDIAALCDVSHMPVRVALQTLEAEGVLDVYPHRGAVIRGVDARFVRNMIEVRAAIEVDADREVRAPHRQGRPRRARGARARLRGGRAAQRSGSAMVSANLRLHDAINRVADNPEALRVLGRGRLLIQALRVRYGYGPGRVEEVVAEHRALLRRDRAQGRAARGRDRAPPLRGRARRAARAAPTA